MNPHNAAFRLLIEQQDVENQELADALESMILVAETYAPSPGHEGPCGP